MLPLIRKLAINMENKDYRYIFVMYVLFVGVRPLLEYVLFQGKYPLNLSIPLITSERHFLLFNGLFYGTQI